VPGHVELAVNQHPQVLLLRAALNPFSAQPVFVLGIAPAHVQDLALDLVEPCEVRTGPFLNPVKVPLGDIFFLQCVNCTTQLGVVGKLAEGALSPTVHVADKEVKQHGSQNSALRNPTCHWCPLGHRATDCNSFSVTQVELHALQLVIDLEGDIPSSSPLPILPKEPVSFHSNIAVIGAIPPRLRDASEVLALYACAHL